jgi:hypothetical protein
MNKWLKSAILIGVGLGLGFLGMKWMPYPMWVAGGIMIAIGIKSCFD